MRSEPPFTRAIRFPSVTKSVSPVMTTTELWAVANDNAASSASPTVSLESTPFASELWPARP